jgi:uncharacterized protein
MSDTTPRPDEPLEDGTPAADGPVDETTADQTPTPEPAEAPETHEAPRAPDAPAPEAAAPPPPPPPPPAAEPPYPAQQPYVGQQAPVAVPGGSAPMSPQDERTWSVATHGIILAALLLSGGTLGFVAALVMYLVYRDKGPYIRANTANALNIQIVTVIAVVIGFVLAITVVGLIVAIPLWIAVGIYALVMHIIGMVKANNGEWWDPPLTPKFVQ